MLLYVGGEVGGADLALGSGSYVPDLPGGAALLHRREHLIGRRSDPIRVDDRADRGGGMEGCMHHGIDSLRSAEKLRGLIAPTSPLL